VIGPVTKYLDGLRGMVEAMRLLGGADEFVVTLTFYDGWRLCQAVEEYLDETGNPGNNGAVATLEGDMAWIKAFGVTIQWPKDAP
jgi:hypothetical protein